MPEAGFRRIESDKEIVVYRGGWGFVLPEQHQVSVNEAAAHVDLHMPQAGGVYDLEGVEETDDEVRVYVGAGGPHVGSALGNIPVGYPFPEIQHELDALRGRMIRASGTRYTDRVHGARGPTHEQQFDAWASGEDLDEKTSRIRR